MDKSYRQIMLSNRSYLKLTEWTISYGYTNHYDMSRVLRIRGIHLLIASVFEDNSPTDWFDTRDPRIRALDVPNPFADDPTIMLKTWFLPEDEPPRNVRRLIKITDHTLDLIAQVASYHSIESPHIQTKHISNNLMSKVGTTLELWGAQYITPRTIVHNPNRFAHKFWADRHQSDGAIMF